eukprot:scpid82754/ scgid21632/ 
MNGLLLLQYQANTHRHDEQASSSSMCSFKCVLVQLLNTIMAVLAVVMFYVIVQGDRRRRLMAGSGIRLSDDFAYAFADLEGEAYEQLADLQKRMEQTKRDVQDRLEQVQPPDSSCPLPGEKAPGDTPKLKKKRKTAKSTSGNGKTITPTSSDEASSSCCKSDNGDCKCAQGKSGKKSGGKGRRSKKKAQLST